MCAKNLLSRCAHRAAHVLVYIGGVFTCTQPCAHSRKGGACISIFHHHGKVHLGVDCAQRKARCLLTQSTRESRTSGSRRTLFRSRISSVFPPRWFDALYECSSGVKVWDLIACYTHHSHRGPQSDTTQCLIALRVSVGEIYLMHKRTHHTQFFWFQPRIFFISKCINVALSLWGGNNCLSCVCVCDIIKCAHLPHKNACARDKSLNLVKGQIAYKIDTTNVTEKLKSICSRPSAHLNYCAHLNP